MRAVRWFALGAVLAASAFGSGCRSCCAPYDYNNPVPCASNYSDSCARVGSRFTGGYPIGGETIVEGEGEIIYEGEAPGGVYSSGVPTPAP